MQVREKIDFIEEWANFVKIDNGWKKIHTKFINTYVKMQEYFIKEMLKTKKGKEKIIKIYKIKNTKGYAQLLGKKLIIKD